MFDVTVPQQLRFSIGCDDQQLLVADPATRRDNSIPLYPKFYPYVISVDNNGKFAGVAEDAEASGTHRNGPDFPVTYQEGSQSTSAFVCPDYSTSGNTTFAATTCGSL